jgi:hypothetical protein
MTLVDDLVTAELARKYPQTPALITRERFEEMLGCLPPTHWLRGGGLESFRLMEAAHFDSETRTDVRLCCFWHHGMQKGCEFHAPDAMSNDQIRAKAWKYLRDGATP